MYFAKLAQTIWLNNKAIYLQNPWQELQMSVHSRPSISTCKPTAYMTWIDLPRKTGLLRQGQPGQAPTGDKVRDVRQLHSQFQTGVARKLEGYHRAMDRDLRPGPQTGSWMHVRNRHRCLPARVDSRKDVATICPHLGTFRRWVPATAPSPRITCTCAPTKAPGASAWTHMRHCQRLPGTWKPTHGDTIQAKPTRTEACACTCACIMSKQPLCHTDHATDKPDMLCGVQAAHTSLLSVVLAEGLSRTEPLGFSKQDRLFSKQVCASPTRTGHCLNSSLRRADAPNGRSR